MITIYRKSGNRDLHYINAVPSYNALDRWLTKNLPWTDDLKEIGQQLKRGNKITTRELKSIATEKGFVFVDYDDTPDYTDDDFEIEDFD